MTNQLFYGDNLKFMRQDIKDESVDLCYIDPPFHSKRNYNQIYNNVALENKAKAQAFVDIWTWDNSADDGFCQIIDSYQGRFTAQTIALIAGLSNVLGKGSLLAYLVSITLRVAEIHRVLKPTGSFYLHCDPTASHYIKLVLDAIFCPPGGMFQNEIIWCYSIGGKSQKRFGRKHDVLFYYTKSDKYTFNIKAASIPRKANSHMKVRADAVGREYQEKTDRRTGKVYKYYLDEGKIAEDYWIDIETLNRRDRERVGYPTQKPEALLERIIKVSSNEGEVVLDACCGCGTSLIVAQRLNRRWIGIDISYQSISLVLNRLERGFGSDMNQVKLNGIPQTMEAVEAFIKCQDKLALHEFEKWAVLTYSNNSAIINQRKGVNKSIEGIVYFLGRQGKQYKIIIQATANNLKLRDIIDLHDMIIQEQAAMAILLTLREPTLEILREAIACEIYQHEVMVHNYPRIQVIPIRKMLEKGKRLDIPLKSDY